MANKPTVKISERSVKAVRSYHLETKPRKKETEINKGKKYDKLVRCPLDEDT